MNFEDFVNDIYRTYNVLDTDNAELQNITDINYWREMKQISYEQAIELHRLNHQLFMDNMR